MDKSWLALAVVGAPFIGGLPRDGIIICYCCYVGVCVLDGTSFDLISFKSFRKFEFRLLLDVDEEADCFSERSVISDRRVSRFYRVIL